MFSQLMGLCSSINYQAAIIGVHAANKGYMKSEYSKELYEPINMKACLLYKHTVDFSLTGVTTSDPQYSRGK